MSDALHLFLGPEPGAALVFAFLNGNAAAAVLITLVALARVALRQVMDPDSNRRLWLIPIVGALVFVLSIHLQSVASIRPPSFADLPAGLGWFVAVWALGAVGLFAWFAVAQVRFMADVRRGRGGPAVVGLISPRIVMPTDDGTYSPEERELIRAHEREHVARKDPRAAGMAALFQCLCWFNPFVHLAAYLLRLDQELACDAAVVRTRPTARGLYARTLLKTQLAATPLPLGCYWSAWGAHPLEVRVAALKRKTGMRPIAATPGMCIVQASGEPIRP